MKIKSSRNGEITLSFTDIGKSCPSSEFLTLQICLLTLLAKINSCGNFRIYSKCDIETFFFQTKLHIEDFSFLQKIFFSSLIESQGTKIFQ